MKVMRILGAMSTMATVGAALLLAPSARAGDDHPHELGDHPAVVVQRLYKAAGYDYASKFYPHPAGLRWYAEPPRDAADGGQVTGRVVTPEAPRQNASSEARTAAERDRWSREEQHGPGSAAEDRQEDSALGIGGCRQHLRPADCVTTVRKGRGV
jgi:hypothetical protein